MQHGSDYKTYESIREGLLRYEGERTDKVNVTLAWKIPQLMRSFYNAKNEAWSAIPHVVLLKDLTSPENLMATTCGDYLAERWGTWSPTILKILDQITEAVLKDLDSPGVSSPAGPAKLHGNDMHSWRFRMWRLAWAARWRREQAERRPITELRTSDTHSGSIELYESAVVISFPSMIHAQNDVDFIEAWDWLCRAVYQAVPDNEMTLSAHHYRFKVVEALNLPKTLRVSCDTKLTISLGKEHTCWRNLFRSCTLVSTSLEQRTRFGKGLEMPFDILLSMAAVEFQLIVENGIVFVGYHTIHYPTAIDWNCAQFHLLTNEEGQINPYLQVYGSRILTGDANQFKRKRCFLGWCADAQINLGTNKLPTSVGYTKGKYKHTSLVKTGYAALAQTGASAPLSAVLGLQTNYTYCSHKLRFDPTSNYHRLLTNAAREVALIYDSSERRAWLVPKLGLLLHMSLAYTAYCGCPNDRVPLVEPYTDGLALTKLLNGMGKNPVLGDGNTAFQFQQLLLGLNINLLRAKDAGKPSVDGKLYGFEFKDIIMQPGAGSCMKKLDLDSSSKAWISLANEVDALLVCSGLGDAITAADDGRVKNGQCHKMPQSHDYLGPQYHVSENWSAAEEKCWVTALMDNLSE